MPNPPVKRDRTAIPTDCRRLSYRYRRRRVVDPFPGGWRAPRPAWAGFAATAGWHPLLRALVLLVLVIASGWIAAGR